jgi:hypothetical protein
MKRHLKIALDCDGVMADFTTGALAIVEEVTGRRHVPAEVKIFDFTAALGLAAREAREVKRRIGSREGFAAGLKPYPEAVQGVARIRELGEVFCVTSPWDSNPWWREERSAWLALHFGIDTVHHAEDKRWYPADVFVDDRAKHVEAWGKTWPNGHAVLWRTLHNGTEPIPVGAHSAGSWDALYQLVQAVALTGRREGRS